MADRIQLAFQLATGVGVNVTGDATKTEQFDGDETKFRAAAAALNVLDIDKNGSADNTTDFWVTTQDTDGNGTVDNADDAFAATAIAREVLDAIAKGTIQGHAIKTDVGAATAADLSAVYSELSNAGVVIGDDVSGKDTAAISAALQKITAAALTACQADANCHQDDPNIGAGSSNLAMLTKMVDQMKWGADPWRNSPTIPADLKSALESAATVLAGGGGPIVSATPGSSNLYPVMNWLRRQPYFDDTQVTWKVSWLTDAQQRELINALGVLTNQDLICPKKGDSGHTRCQREVDRLSATLVNAMDFRNALPELDDRIDSVFDMDDGDTTNNDLFGRHRWTIGGGIDFYLNKQTISGFNDREFVGLGVQSDAPWPGIGFFLEGGYKFPFPLVRGSSDGAYTIGGYFGYTPHVVKEADPNLESDVTYHDLMFGVLSRVSLGWPRFKFSATLVFPAVVGRIGNDEAIDVSRSRGFGLHGGDATDADQVTGQILGEELGGLFLGVGAWIGVEGHPFEERKGWTLRVDAGFIALLAPTTNRDVTYPPVKLIDPSTGVTIIDVPGATENISVDNLMTMIRLSVNH